ncbi:MAG: hypothetical protein ACK58T_34485, partial [Phycisphaerae bacterium]
VSAPKVYTYIVRATGIANIVGGKGINTYKVRAANALQGAITTPVGGQNTLDYSDYSGGAPVIIDTYSRAATGLRLATAPIARQKVQRLQISTAVSGTFSLQIGG